MPGQSCIALVTGGSRGLGHATVLALATRGVDSIFTYHSSRPRRTRSLRRSREPARVRSRCGSTRAIPEPSPGSRAKWAECSGGWDAERFNYLVNNAGTSHHAAIADVTEADFDALYRVHVKGVFFLTQRLLPLIADGGRIVNISSALARVAYPGSAAYGAMKGAVEVLTRYMARELGPAGSPPTPSRPVPSRPISAAAWSATTRR